MSWGVWLAAALNVRMSWWVWLARSSITECDSTQASTGMWLLEVQLWNIIPQNPVMQCDSLSVQLWNVTPRSPVLECDYSQSNYGIWLQLWNVTFPCPPLTVSYNTRGLFSLKNLPRKENNPAFPLAPVKYGIEETCSRCSARGVRKRLHDVQCQLSAHGPRDDNHFSSSAVIWRSPKAIRR
jgi:hypothetical protein